MSAESTLADGSTRHAIDLRRFGWIRPLAGDYAFDFAKISALYAGDPTSGAAWADAIRRTQAHTRQPSTIADVLARQQARRGAPAPSREAARKLSDPRTVAVVTGQQAGAFGGPLFTLLKAITALQLARRAAREHQADAVAVFWVDAEDHDWDEVASCTVLDGAFQPRTVTLSAPDGAGERPVASLTLDARVERSLGELNAALASTEFTAGVMSSLREAYRPGTGMAQAFARWLDTLLGPYGLVVFESTDPSAKSLVADLFARELRAPGRTARLAAAAGNMLRSQGHQPQVVQQPDSISLFHLDGARRPIRRQGGDFIVGDKTFAADVMAREAVESPGHFSPNVLLRPIVQDTLFPTIAYVAGPSELAYLGQLREVYDSFGVPMPLIYPRATATLVDSAAARFLNRYGIPLEQLQPQDESALNRLLESQLPASVEEAMRAAHDATSRVMERLIEVLPSLDPTLAGAAETTRGRLEHDLRALHNKIIQAVKRRDETLRRQFTRAQSQIFPLGHPQERTLAALYFLNRYGPALVDRLLEDLPLELGHHWVMTV